MGIFSAKKLSEHGQRNYDIGTMYMERQDWENALKYFNKTLESDPANQEAIDAISQLKKKIKEIRKEIDLTKDIIFFTTKILTADQINWYFENNYLVYSVGYGIDTWGFCFIKNFANLSQRVLFTPDIPTHEIEQLWHENFYITHVGFDGNKWLLIMQNVEGVGNQKWFLNSHFPEDQIDSFYKKGYAITNCCYGSSWLVVMDENSFFTDQEYIFYEEYPDEEIDEIWENDRYLNNLLYDGEHWLIIHSECEQWDSQELINPSRFPFSNLQKKFDETGVLPTSIQHDGSDWNIILSSVAIDENDEEIEESEISEISIEQALAELNQLTGLKAVKEEVNNLVALIDLNKLKAERGMNIAQMSNHLVFTGSPGTGKTTVARIIGKIFKALGILSKGHITETDRAGLVGEYIGHTAIKTMDVIEKAMDGVLFIDEAYALAKDNGNDFGQEAIDTLLKQMEDKRDRIVVIVAGYTNEMKNFIQSNPGLKSRFNTFVHFEDYSPNELLEILKKLIMNLEHQISWEAESFALEYFKFIYQSRDKYFGNARTVRNLFEDVLKIQSARLSKEKDLTDEQLKTIERIDLEKSVKDHYTEQKEISIEGVMQELDKLIGLSNVKQQIKALADFIKIEQLRIQKGLSSNSISLHTVFYGPPGTGKTTVARLVGKIYKLMGLLSKGHVVECSRSDLVGEYIGQTAIKTNKKIDEALHGILFIDEAYSLSNNSNSGDFGKEVIETVLKRMEDDRDKLCVIIAGYTSEMNRFINSNPGLKSRFTNNLFFEDFTANQLLEIMKGYFESGQYSCHPEVTIILQSVFEKWIQNKTVNFGNARDVRNLFEKIKLNQSKRLMKISNISAADLTTVCIEDVTTLAEIQAVLN